MALALCTMRAPSSYDGAGTADLLVNGLDRIYEAGVYEEGIWDTFVQDSQAIVTVTVDTSASDVIVPSGITASTPKHISSLEIWVDGTQIDPSFLTNGVTVTRSLDRAIQTASFGVLAQSLGNPFTRHAPPMCSKTVDIYGVYQTSSGVKRFPIIVGGVVASMQIEDTGFDIQENYTIVDRGGRVQREAVTFILPQGHGLRRDRVAEKVLVDEIGESSANVALRVSREMNKAVQMVDADPVAALQAIFDAEYRQLLWSPDGKADNPRRRARDEDGSQMTITSEHIVRGSGLGFTGSGDVITQLTLTTDKQIIRSEEDACGYRTEIFETTHSQTFEPEWQSTQQNANCTRSALTPPTISPSLQPVQKVIVTLTYFCDTLVYEKTETYRWYNRLRSRYQYDQGLSVWECLAGPYLGSAAADGPDDTEPAYRDRKQKWTKVSEEVIEHYYDKNGYYGPRISTAAANALGVFPSEAPFSPAAPHTVDGETVQLRSEIEGSKLGTKRTLKQFHQRRRAIKTRASDATAWDTVDITDNLHGLAEKDGVATADAIEQFRTTEIDYEILEPDEEGLLKRRVVVSERYAARPGAGNLYADGTESRDETETLVVAGMVDESFLQTEEKHHKVVTTVSGLDGKLVEVVAEDIAGGVQPIERLPGADSSETTFLTADELTNFNAREFSPEQTETIVVEVDASDLETCFLKREVNTSLPYAENEEELQEVGEAMVDEARSFRLRVPMLGNFLVREGQKVHVTASLPTNTGSYEIDHDCTIKELTHRWTGLPRDPVFTDLELLMHP